jgi:HK97 family phage portal protein
MLHIAFMATPPFASRYFDRYSQTMKTPISNSTHDNADIVIVRNDPLAPLAKMFGIAPMPPLESTLDSKVIGWPMDQNGLYLLYRYSAEHMRCCQIKAESAFGFGVSGPGADRMAPLMPAGMGLASFMVALGLDLETYGNAFVEKVKYKNTLIGLRRLPARTMYRSLTGGFCQWVYEIDGDLREITFEADEVVHIKEPCPAAFSYSLPTWIGAHDMLELVYAAITFNASFFRNRAIPDYAIWVEGGQMSAEAKATAKLFFQTEFQGPENAHRALYLDTTGSGTKIHFEKLTENRKDGEFLKLLDAARERIITAHGVPPRLLGIVSAGQLGGGGENEGQLQVFEQLTCAPRRRRMVERLAPVLDEIGAPKGDDRLVFKPMDTTTSAADKQDTSDLVAADIMTRDEARERLGLAKKSVADSLSAADLVRILEGL